jgi:hypothetical protein
MPSQCLTGASGPSRDHLATLDEAAVWVAQVAAELMTPACRRCQELGPSGAPLLVDGADVGDADVEESADVIGVARRLERHRYAEAGKGGHFAALEQPEILVSEIRTGLRTLRS